MKEKEYALHAEQMVIAGIKEVCKINKE